MRYKRPVPLSNLSGSSLSSLTAQKTQSASLSSAKKEVPEQLNQPNAPLSGQKPQSGHNRGPLSVLTGWFKPAVAAALLSLGTGTALAQQTSPQGLSLDTVQTSAQVHASLDGAHQRLLAANTDGGKWIDGRGWGNELTEIDSLAQSVFNYVDYFPQNGNISLWGRDLQGVYSVGGLGVGHAFRPQYMGGHGSARTDALEEGIVRLKHRLDNGPKQDQAQTDLNTLSQKHQLTSSGDFQRLHQSLEGLQEHILELVEAKEKRLGESFVQLSHAELLESLPEGSIEVDAARLLLEGEGFKTQFKYQLRVLPEQKEGVVNDAVTHYLLLLSMRAQEAHLIAKIKEHL